MWVDDSPGGEAELRKLKAVRKAVGGTFDDKVSGMIAELPVGLADPVERLNAITAQMDGLKEYNGHVNFGTTDDYDSRPDISVLTEGIEEGMAELLKLDV